MQICWKDLQWKKGEMDLKPFYWKYSTKQELIIYSVQLMFLCLKTIQNKRGENKQVEYGINYYNPENNTPVVLITTSKNQ